MMSFGDGNRGSLLMTDNVLRKDRNHPDSQPFQVSTQRARPILLFIGLVANFAAAAIGVTLADESWPIRIVTVVLGIGVGLAIGWKQDLWRVLAAIAIAVGISVAMLTNTISFWLGFTALMSAAAGSTARQAWESRSHT